MKIHTRGVRTAKQNTPNPKGSRVSSGAASNSPLPLWRRAQQSSSNDNRLLQSFILGFKFKKPATRINQYTLLQFWKYVGKNDFQEALKGMNILYNDGVSFSDERITSVLFNLCLYHQWILQAKQVVRLYHGWLRKPPLTGDLLDFLTLFCRKGDTNTTVWLLSVIRDDWQMQLDGRFYQLAIARVLKGRKRRLVPWSSQHKNGTGGPTPTINEESTRRPVDPSTTVVAQGDCLQSVTDRSAYDLPLGSLLGVEHHVVNSLILYLDAVQLGIRLPLETHHTVLDALIFEFRRRQKILYHAWKNATARDVFWSNQEGVNFPGELMAKCRDNLAQNLLDSSARRSLQNVAALRILSHCCLIHERIFLEHPHHIVVPYNVEARFPRRLLETFSRFYHLLEELPDPLRQMGSIKYQPRQLRQGGSEGFFVGDIVTTRGLKNALQWVGAELRCL